MFKLCLVLVVMLWTNIVMAQWGGCGNPACVMCYGYNRQSWQQPIQRVQSVQQPQRQQVQYRTRVQEQAVTPLYIVEEMLTFAQVTSDDYVCDLGSGDGRFVMAAARRGCFSVGVENDPIKVRLSRKNIKSAGYTQAYILYGDVRTVREINNAEVICVYLYEDLMRQLIPQFQRLKPGTRIVSYLHKIPGIAPDKTITILGPDNKPQAIHMWTCPLKTAVRSVKTQSVIQTPIWQGPLTIGGQGCNGTCDSCGGNCR